MIISGRYAHEVPRGSRCMKSKNTRVFLRRLRSSFWFLWESLCLLARAGAEQDFRLRSDFFCHSYSSCFSRCSEPLPKPVQRRRRYPYGYRTSFSQSFLWVCINTFPVDGLSEGLHQVAFYCLPLGVLRYSRETDCDLCNRNDLVSGVAFDHRG